MVPPRFYSSKGKSSLNSSRLAFTLLELMIVIAIMALMMGLVGLTLIGGGGAVLGSAQRELISLVQQARMQAVLSGRETRLIVHDDPTNPEKFHRYVEIVYDDSNGTGVWRPMGEGILLPDEACIVPVKERFDQSVAKPSNTDWPTGAYSIWSAESSQLFKLGTISKGVRSENGFEAVEYRYLAFDKAGNVICPSGVAAPGGVPPSPCIVLGIGPPLPEGGDKAVQFNNPDDLAGVLLRRYGGFATLSSTDFGN